MEYSKPSASDITPVAMVIHNGPRVERLYRCLMSCQPSCSHSSCWFHPRTRSSNARPNVLDFDGGVFSPGGLVMRATSALSCSTLCTQLTLVHRILVPELAVCAVSDGRA